MGIFFLSTNRGLFLAVPIISMEHSILMFLYIYILESTLFAETPKYLHLEFPK